MKGIVVGIKRRRAVIMESGGGFREIKNQGYRPGQEIEIPKKRTSVPFAMAACLALFFLSGVVGYRFYNTPQCYLYIDINPSLRLEMNYFGNVISAVPLNEDAVVLLKQCELDLSDGQKCVDSIIQGSLELGYLNEEHPDVEIDFHTSNEKLMEEIIAVGDRITEDGVSVTVFELDQAQHAIALANGVSASRMRALESYTEFFGGTLEDNKALLAQTTSSEIYAQIRQYRRSTVGADANVYTDPDVQGREAEQGKTQSRANAQSEAYATRLRQAVDSYTEFFGGSAEENTKLLEALTIGEIYEKIKSDRLVRHAGKQSADDSKASQAKAPNTSTQTGRTSQQLAQRRRQAVESYTDYFGGSIEENEEKLTGLTIAQIYEAVRNDRSSQ